MKKTKILFWVATSILFLFEGLMPILTFNSPLAVSGITSLGYPVYFVAMLSIFKGLGGFALIIPQVPARIKEWAYAGYTFDFLCAFISIWVVGGISTGLLLPLLALAVLYVSYTSYHKLQASK